VPFSSGERRGCNAWLAFEGAVPRLRGRPFPAARVVTWERRCAARSSLVLTRAVGHGARRRSQHRRIDRFYKRRISFGRNAAPSGKWISSCGYAKIPVRALPQVAGRSRTTVPRPGRAAGVRDRVPAECPVPSPFQRHCSCPGRNTPPGPDSALRASTGSHLPGDVDSLA